MNTNQLKYFVAAAENQSFTKAAEQHYVSQTAVTQQIRLLEETLGCRLFDRTTRPVTLTTAGRAFLIEAKAILERMSRAIDRVHDASTGLIGTLRVGYVRGYERSDLSVLMRGFHETHSNVLITFYRCSTDVLAAGLLSNEYDIIFTWDSTNLKQNPDIEYLTVEHGWWWPCTPGIPSHSELRCAGQNSGEKTFSTCRLPPPMTPMVTLSLWSSIRVRATSPIFCFGPRIRRAC